MEYLAEVSIFNSLGLRPDKRLLRTLVWESGREADGGCETSDDWFDVAPGEATSAELGARGGGGGGGCDGAGMMFVGGSGAGVACSIATEGSGGSAATSFVGAGNGVILASATVEREVPAVVRVEATELQVLPEKPLESDCLG